MKVAYDLMGRVRSIDYDKGFRQDIYYADGPGTPRYNGMVSAMSWRTGETMAASDSKRKH